MRSCHIISSFEWSPCNNELNSTGFVSSFLALNMQTEDKRFYKNGGTALSAAWRFKFRLLGGQAYLNMCDLIASSNSSALERDCGYSLYESRPALKVLDILWWGYPVSLPLIPRAGYYLYQQIVCHLVQIPDGIYQSAVQFHCCRILKEISFKLVVDWWLHELIDRCSWGLITSVSVDSGSFTSLSLSDVPGERRSDPVSSAEEQSVRVPGASSATLQYTLLLSLLLAGFSNSRLLYFCFSFTLTWQVLKQ